MLLHRVSLQGFLAHYGQEINGAILPIDLDFRESNLWLMHGANGSGKSSVFDAITFALFDKARGSQISKLVNDRSSSAAIEVEFENRGERYLVKRRIKLKRNRDGHLSSPPEVSRWNADENRWIAEEGVGKIADWSRRVLQVSYENFVSSVILEQGRADQFLRATPKNRRQQLMELLDLKVYDQISEVANARYRISRATLKSKEAQLENCVAVAPEAVANAEHGEQTAQTRVAQANEAMNRAQKVRDDAGAAAEWEAQIAAKERRQGADAALTAEAKTIENAVKERDELNAILPSLRALSAARRALAVARKDWQTAQTELETARDKERESAPIVEQTRAINEAAARALTEASLSAAQAELNGGRAAADAEILSQIEELEAQIAQCERELEPQRAWLNRAVSIESRRAQIEQLTGIIGAVRPIHEASQRLARAQATLAEAQAAHQSALEKAREAETQAQRANAALRDLEGAGDDLKTESARLDAKLEVNRETLSARDEVGHAEECPMCGSALDDPDARARIEAERALLRREVEQWQTRLGEIEAQARALSADKKARAQTDKAAREAFEQTSKLANRTEAHSEAATRDGAERARDLRETRAAAGAWADENLASLQARVAALEPQTIESDWSALQRARTAQIQIEATAGASRAQLKRLPAWNDEKRRAIGELQRDLAGVLATARAAQNAAQDRAQAANDEYKSAQESSAAAGNAVKIAIGLEAQRAMATANAQTELEAQLDKLAAPWNEHHAARADGALDELAARYQAAQPLAARLGELREAEQRVSHLQSEIGLLRAQIAKIPEQHRVPVAAAETTVTRARAELSEAENELQSAKENLLITRTNRATFERYEAELTTAQIEANRDKDLAEALGRDGLQARIIKQAQENLCDAANGILGRLSRGQWQIDLRAQGEDESELEIIARDEGRGGHERAFDALSGGERFRVAISLAIAIGQMASGGAPMNTLVIDEGFGALDEENRGLMVDNLRHLSEHELKNGRIIVVSHQDDVRDAFGHRYQLSRDEQGYARIEMTVG